MDGAQAIQLTRGSALGKAPHSLPASDSALMRLILDWADEYLCEPHSELGRDGPVCPFTRPSLTRDACWLTVNRATDLAAPAIYEHLVEIASLFGTLDPRQQPDARYKTVLILLPDVTDPSALDGLQRRLKSSFVKRGLMVGQFYSTCDEPGLWNVKFRPLRSPTPLLAIRHMVPSDFPFLVAEQEWLSAYFAQFAPDVPPHVRSSIARLVLQGERDQ